MKNYIIKIDDEIWSKFTQGIPRNTNINDYLIELIKKDIEKKEVLNGN
jgi:hypothetical protein